MQSLKVSISEIKKLDGLNLVKFSFFDLILTMFSLDLDDDIVVGLDVFIGFKSTDISIVKEFSGISSDINHLKVLVIDVEDGEFLSSIKLDLKGNFIDIIITKESSKALNLQVQDEVSLFINPSEIFISSICDD